MSYFGTKLRCLRKQNKLTQQELANALGLAKSTISMYENGQREPDFETIEAIADFFNAPMRTFFPGGLENISDKKESATLTDGGLSPEQLEVLRLYDSADPVRRQIVLDILKSAEAADKAGDTL